jgi:hypothetical protein
VAAAVVQAVVQAVAHRVVALGQMPQAGNRLELPVDPPIQVHLVHRMPHPRPTIRPEFQRPTNPLHRQIGQRHDGVTLPDMLSCLA